MAGDWIKIEQSTPDKPEIFALANLMEIHPDRVLGMLVRVWLWADEQTTDGRLGSGADAAIDRVVGAQNFSKKMIETGWLKVRKKGFIIPNFERHNGNSAKTRALAARRMVTLRDNKRDDSSVTSPSPEKRREEKSKKDIARVVWNGEKFEVPEPILGEYQDRFPNIPLVEICNEIVDCGIYHFEKKTKILNPQSRITTWLKNTFKNTSSKQSFDTPAELAQGKFNAKLMKEVALR